MKVAVQRVKDEAIDIRSYELVDPLGRSLPSFSAGAHIDVHLEVGLVRQYSLCNDPRETHRYVIAVLREPQGRGGSSFIHASLCKDSRITISSPRNNFSLVEGAARYLLIAGGIGITPIISMARCLEAGGENYTLHYCARCPERMAFYEELKAPPFADRTRFHFDGGIPSCGLDVRSLLKSQAAGRHVYCCGPVGLINAVIAATANWQPGTAHFEYFKSDLDSLSRSGQKRPFEIEIASTGQVFLVPEEKSILQVLQENGFSHKSSCEEGLCGTCATGLLAGEAEHRDFVLSAEEKASQTVIMVCCSRARTRRLKLDL